jgi:hypothetical protein
MQMSDRMKEAYYAMLHVENEDINTMTPDQYQSFLTFCRLCTPESRERLARQERHDADNQNQGDHHA